MQKTKYRKHTFLTLNVNINLMQIVLKWNWNIIFSFVLFIYFALFFSSFVLSIHSYTKYNILLTLSLSLCSLILYIIQLFIEYIFNCVFQCPVWILFLLLSLYSFFHSTYYCLLFPFIKHILEHKVKPLQCSFMHKTFYCKTLNEPWLWYNIKHKKKRCEISFSFKKENKKLFVTIFYFPSSPVDYLCTVCEDSDKVYSII